jgi:nicotinamide mononucleotide adenylyltransferase
MEKVNIILGRFQPFTDGHLKMIEAGYRENGFPTVILQIPNKKFDERHPFSDELIKEEIDMIRSSVKNTIIDHFYIINADIAKIASICHEHDYEPVLWLCGSDRYEAYSKQANNKKYKSDNDLLPEFKCFEIKRDDDDISASKVREAIKNDDFTTYIEMMPGIFMWYTNIWDKFKEELKNLE